MTPQWYEGLAKSLADAVAEALADGLTDVAAAFGAAQDLAESRAAQFRNEEGLDAFLDSLDLDFDAVDQLPPVR